jgi:hypothetical protein
MAKTGWTKRYYNFIGGKHSDGSALVAPENTARTMVNVDLEVSGKISRRLGLDFEKDFEAAIANIPVGALNVSDFGMYQWTNVDNGINANFLVVIINATMYFFNEGSVPLSSGLVGTLNIGGFNTGTPFSTDLTITVASGKGVLFVCGEKYNPFYVSYDPSTDTFSGNWILMEVRDTLGIDDELSVDERPSTLSQAHSWNLANQGWPEGRVNEFKNDIGSYPSNADIHHLGFKVNATTGEKEWKASEITNTDLGTSPSARGRFLINAFEPDRIGVFDPSRTITSTFDIPTPSFLAAVASGMITGGGAALSGYGLTTVNNEIGPFIPLAGTLLRPKAVAFYAGRAWYASTEGKIFFSNIIEDLRYAGRCYQEQDPTAEDFNELVDTDGGVLQLTECGTVTALVPGLGGLILFATGGIWKIFGGDVGFTANNTFVTKVSTVSVRSVKSIVEAEGRIYFWSDEGIFTLISDSITGNPQAQSISAARIQKDFNEIPTSARDVAQGFYDSVEKKIYWSYNDGLLDQTENKARYNSILILDLILNAYYDYRVEDGGVGDIQPFFSGMVKRAPVNESISIETVYANTDIVLVGTETVVTDALTKTSTNFPLTIACFYPDSLTATDFNFTFGEFCSRSFHDWKSTTDWEVNYESIVEMNPETLNEGMLDKQATYLYSYYDFKREGFGQQEYEPRFETGKGFRVSQNVIEILRQGIPALRATQNAIEILRQGEPKLAASQSVIEILRSGDPDMNVTQSIIEIVRSVS